MPPTIETNALHPGIVIPEQVGPLIVQPVDRMSVAMQVSRVVETASPTFRLPLVLDDVSASWVAEGAEIAEDSPVTDEEIVTPVKLAALTIVSSELANDSSPDAAQVVGQSIARNLARQIDLAYFGSAVGLAPNGLGNLTGINAVDAGAAWTDLDAFAEAINHADSEGREITAFVTSPADALALAVLKDQTDSNRPLLGTALEGTRRMALGVPVWVSPGVPEGVVYGLPQDVSMVVRRADISLVVDRSRWFERDSVGIRATMRVGFSWPHAASVQKISLTA